MKWIRLAATLPLMWIVLAAPARAGSAAEQHHRVLKTFFTVEIDEGADAPLAAGGTLLADVAPDGAFVGHLKPVDFFDQAMPSVIFRGADATPDPAYAAGVAVKGQINGHAFNLVVDLGPGGQIYGAGTATVNLDHLHVDKASFQIGGAAVGPGPHDKGDWRAAPVQPPTGENCIVPYNHCEALCDLGNFSCQLGCQATLASCQAGSSR
jgi:hypothetical protein